MPDVISITSDGSVHRVDEKPFQDEVTELQDYIKRNPEILGSNVSMIADQLDTGLGERLDLLAVQENVQGVGTPLIVELKNEPAGKDVLLQVLRYAKWVLANPDSIRLYAKEAGLEGIEIDDSNVRIVVVAPRIYDELLELSAYIAESIDFDFLELSRFEHGDEDLVVVEHRVALPSDATATRVRQEWNWDKYRTQLGISEKRIAIGQHLFQQLTSLNESRDWGLQPVFRKLYIPFKRANRVVVFIDYWPAKPCWLGFRLPAAPEELGLQLVHPELEQKYVPSYQQYEVKIESTDINVADFEPYILKALES